MSGAIFSFDIGTGSLGIAVRKKDAILETQSLLIPDEFASTKEQRDRRRQYRTRQAHKAREEWLKEKCKEAGIEILEGRRPGNRKKGIKPKLGDPRLEREFAKSGDTTIYTSSLLRILLLRGENLEGWQIYKALHSAIQRRGYDPDVPWKSRHSNSDDEKDTNKKITEYENKLAEISGGKEEYMYPCYFDAFKIGLWNPETNMLTFTQNNEAERARGRIAPRYLVEKEVRDLVNAAAKYYPALSGKADYILYGPSEEAYASIYPEKRKEFGLKEGGKTDWNGVLGQKIPRFDNRALGKCVLIPRYNTCRADDHLVMQVVFLLKLLNMRYEKYEKGIYAEKKLTAEDIRIIFEEKKQKASDKKSELIKKGKEKKEWPKEIADKVYRFTKSEWKKWLDKNKNGIPKPNHELVEAPKVSGRSRYSRPALRLLKELILSGESPHTFYNRKAAEITNTDPKKGMVIDDLEFLLRMPDDAENIFIPQLSLAEKYIEVGKEYEDGIKLLINSQNNPIVRHRLGIFKKYLDTMTQKYGTPDSVVIEFVREDFLGEEQRKKLVHNQNENRKLRKEAKDKAEELGLDGKKALTKLRLLKQQGCICLYTGESLTENELDEYDIDHVVPRHGRYNGSDSFNNKVLTKRRTNNNKGDKTPFEFLQERGEWRAYCERVKDHAKDLKRRKVALLTSEHPEELDEKYTSLADTSWIARLARDIACLTYGWQPGESGEKQRVFTVKGGFTAKIRRDNKIDSLLAPDAEGAEEIEKKNRGDKRHHALDAMVLSFFANQNKSLPEHINRDYFKHYIDNVVPKNIALSKPALEETIYAKRHIDGKDVYVYRTDIKGLAYKGAKFSAAAARKNVRGIIDKGIREQIGSFLETEPDQASWDDFVTDLHQSPDYGSRVKKAMVFVSDADEFVNVSKTGGRGQYKKAAKHQGQYVYYDAENKIRVRPVYAFESKQGVKKELEDNNSRVVDFFTAGCLVEIEQDIDLGNRVIPSGKYILGSIWTNGQVKILGPHPELANPVGIKTLLEAGFRRVD